MKWRLFLLVLVLGASGVQAQTKKELAARVLQAQQVGIENVARALAGQTAQRVMQSAGQAIERLAADKREAAARDVQAEVKKFYDELEPMLRKRAVELAPAVVGTAYEERFTEDELKQVLAWLESPVSAKFSQLDRDLGSALAEKVVAETRSTVEVRMKALDAALVKRLGTSPIPRAASAPRKP
jgi:hypothetical protein